MLYAFDNLKSFINLHFPDKNTIIRENLVVKGENFTQKFVEGKISFRENGIFVNINGIDFPRYIYLQRYYINKYGHPPVFHIIKCSVVKDIGSGHFASASSSLVDIYNRDTNEYHRNLKLKLCSYCRDEIMSNHTKTPKDTEEFNKQLELFELEESNNPNTDLSGYSFNWDEISKNYKEIKNYKCESCGFEPDTKFDNRFIHTHHKDGNKKKYKDNLECVCILCHSFKDEHHIENFEKNSMKKELKEFVEKYRDKLKALKNKYLEKYDNIQLN